jgi:hypothetical protein
MKTKMTKVIYATIMLLFLTGSMFAQTGSVGILSWAPPGISRRTLSGTMLTIQAVGRRGPAHGTPD